MAPYISESERKAASQMTWTILVAQVSKANHQCEEREARRQIGNAIADGRLFARWADKPVIPPMPGSKFSLSPKTASSVLSPDDTPPRDATYGLECEVDATDPDRVLEPPLYDPGMVDKRTAKRLDKMRRFRKPIFKRDAVLQLWPIVQVRTSDKVESTKAAPPTKEPHVTPTAKSALRDDNDAQYKDRLNDFWGRTGRYPSRAEDEIWGQEQELSRKRVRDLRRQLIPDEIKKGGAPKKMRMRKLAENNLAAKLPS